MKKESRKQPGFTLIEVLMAMSLLMVGALLVFHSVQVIRSLSTRYSAEMVRLTEAELGRLILAREHPTQRVVQRQGWTIRSRTEVREHLIHFFVETQHPRLTAEPYRLYTTRLASEYSAVE